MSGEFPLITKIDFLSQHKGCCIVSLINLNSLMFIIYTRRDRSRPVLFKFNETIKKLRKIIFQGSSGRCCHRTSPTQSVVFHRLSKLIFYLTERLLYSLAQRLSGLPNKEVLQTPHTNNLKIKEKIIERIIWKCEEFFVYSIS